MFFHRLLFLISFNCISLLRHLSELYLSFTYLPFADSHVVLPDIKISKGKGKGKGAPYNRP